MRMLMDNCFLRLVNDFEKAKDLQNIKVCALDYNDQIHLLPGETYTFITRTNTGIAFDNNYSAYLVDAFNNVLNTITDKVFIEEFEDNQDGLPQIKIELLQLDVDHITDLVSLRIDHDILNGDSFWSNPFIISEYDSDKTTRFDFKHYENLDGTCYEVANIYQSIRLKCFKEKNVFVSSSQSYTTMEGLAYSSRLIKTKAYSVVFDMLNDFIYDRIQYLLSHDIIYIDGIRITDKQTFENDDKFSVETNVSKAKFKVSVDENDTYQSVYQIVESLQLIQFNPSGSYTAQIPVIVNRTFSNNFALQFGSNIIGINNKSFSNKFSDKFGA